MIKMSKGAIPKVLADNCVAWTKAVTSKLAKGEELTATEKGRYSHTQIKEAIVEETHGKCAYCESAVRHIAYGDIEHITPKDVDPTKWFDWNNLTLACDVCNTKKGTEVDIVDPYNCDPEKRFAFIGAAIWGVPGDEQSTFTERTLELNRADLIGKRTERIERLMTLIEVIEKTSNIKLKNLYKEDFKNELSDKAEYAALSRTIHREFQRRGFFP